jgi:vitamin-K-epoxide reductase (warfarin-sensitive)
MSLRISERQFWTMLVLGACGLCDAIYLTMEHYLNLNPPCYVGSCETVLSSSYAMILGVPVAVWGVVYYVSVVGGLLYYMSTLDVRILKLTLLATVAGLFASLYFFSLMAWVIEAWCQYCLLSGALSLGLFLITVKVYIQSKRPQ